MAIIPGQHCANVLGSRRLSSAASLGDHWHHMAGTIAGSQSSLHRLCSPSAAPAERGDAHKLHEHALSVMLVKQGDSKTCSVTAADFMLGSAHRRGVSEAGIMWHHAAGRAVCHVLHMTKPQSMTCCGLCGEYLYDAVTAGVLQQLSCLLRLCPALLCCPNPGSPCLHAQLSFHHGVAHHTYVRMWSTYWMERSRFAHAAMLEG